MGLEYMEITNKELAVLGLVFEEPKYGYQIEQDIKNRGMREWTEIGFSSIYYILNKLEQKHWLESKKDFETKHLPRKIYQITSNGSELYLREILQRLRSPRPQSADFDLALGSLSIIPHSEALQAIKDNQASLENQIKKVELKWQADLHGPMPEHVNLLFDHSLHRMKAELEWLKKLENKLITKSSVDKGNNYDREN